jgi:tryptophan-rich sensory protein
MNNIAKLVISITIPVAIGATAGFFTVTGVDSWYQTIHKPSWNPPGWVFGPVWTTLYILMGIALFLVWKTDAGNSIKKKAIIIFAVQLMLNFFWSFIFFSQQQIGWAFMEIIVLWVMILATIFAAMLNYTIWRLN